MHHNHHHPSSLSAYRYSLIPSHISFPLAFDFYILWWGVTNSLSEFAFSFFLGNEYDTLAFSVVAISFLQIFS